MRKITAVCRNPVSARFSLKNLGKALILAAFLAAVTGAYASPSLTRISCGSATFSAAGTDLCSVYLSAQTYKRVNVYLSSNNPAVTVPTSVTVKSGASSTGFNAMVGTFTTPQTATITAQAGGIVTTFSITLSPPTVSSLSLSPSSIAFGSVPVGTPVSKPVTVTSTGTAPVTIYADAITGAGFSPDHPAFPLTLNPGQSAIFTVWFNPASAGSVTGQLSVSSNAPTAYATLTGTGASAGPSISGLTCAGNSFAGSGSTTCTVSLSAPAPSAGQSVAVTSNVSAVTVPASVVVPAGSSAASFTASVASVTTTQTATITATANSSSRSFAIQLNAATPSLSLSASSLAFGNVSVGTAVSKSVTITSSGTAAVTINTDSISGTGFSVSGGNLPATLNPGQAIVVSVQFGPTTAGSVTGQLTIASNAPIATVSLSGTGTAIAPTVSAISCSNTSITGALADSCTVTLSGSAPTGGVIVGLTSSNSAVTVPASVTVPATATSSVFTANVASVTTAQSVTVTATTGTTSKSISLQLNAATPVLSVNASSIPFGSVVVNTATTQNITLTSSGTAALTVSSIAVTGSAFAVSPGSLPITLNPGQTKSLTLTFDPATAGSFTGQLTITSNSSSNPTLAIPLTGTGTAVPSYQVNLSWQAPSSPSDPIAGYHVYRAPSGTTSYALLNSALDVQTAYTDSNVKNGTSYDYMVKSVDGSGTESAPSNTTTINIP